MLGELLFFVIYLCQQLGVMLGVGAQTLLLCTHLVALHRREPEHLEGSFARAARMALGLGLALIVLSGVAAVATHVVAGNVAVLLAPAFLFKWVLIVVVLCAYLFQKHLVEWSNTLAWFAGGSWYALFLVHSLAPVTSWFNLLLLYAGWMAFFAAAWAGFVLLMHGVKLSPAKPPLRVAPLPKPAPVVVAAIPKPAPVLVVPPKPPAPPPPPPVPKPVSPPPPPAPLPVVAAPEPLPMIIPQPVVPPPPPPKPVPPPPKPPLPLLKTVQAAAHKFEETWLPALRIMPQKVEDIGKQERGPVVNLDQD